MSQDNKKSERDKLTRRVTAFPNWHALEAAMAETGYFPTLRHDRIHDRSLGAIIEGLGRRVFWIGKGASYAS
jgi:hypothetical protein